MSELSTRISQYAPVELTPDLTQLPDELQRAVMDLEGLVPIMEEEFRQLTTRDGGKIIGLMKMLRGMATGELGLKLEEYITYLEINQGTRDYYTKEAFQPEFTAIAQQEVNGHILRQTDKFQETCPEPARIGNTPYRRHYRHEQRTA